MEWKIASLYPKVEKKTFEKLEHEARVKVLYNLGNGIHAECENNFEFSAIPYTCHEMEQARHLWELPKPYATVLRINKAQTGIGGDNNWGAWTHDEYIINPEREMQFKLKIKPL